MRQLVELDLGAVERRPIAKIDLEPEELTRLTGVTFGEDVEEGLGPFRWAAVEVGGVVLVLNRYEMVRFPGMDVFAEADDARHAEGLAALLAELGLTAGAITWRATGR